MMGPSVEPLAVLCVVHSAGHVGTYWTVCLECEVRVWPMGGPCGVHGAFEREREGTKGQEERKAGRDGGR